MVSFYRGLSDLLIPRQCWFMLPFGNIRPDYLHCKKLPLLMTIHFLLLSDFPPPKTDPSTRCDRVTLLLQAIIFVNCSTEDHARYEMGAAIVVSHKVFSLGDPHGWSR